ncbi:MAG TPA: MBL fold metallo-hydrolase, partial [Vicinamibacterales bacterium]|nr:MBL fold metallo-hydrolase [Vicinamibacterales bacterium]
MKRVLVLGTLIAVGALSIVASGQAPQGPSAEAKAAARIERVRGNLYVITGSGAENQALFSGGNTAVFITETGVTLVDTKLPGFGPTILERIKTVTDKPVTRIINTHSHGDHTGGNLFFGTTVESIVHENARASMAKAEYSGDNAKFLPKRTYTTTLTLGSGSDRIDLYHFGRGHTNGDTFIVFPALRTMHAGDMFAWKALPYVDAGNGGSVVGQPDSLARAAAVPNVDTVIPGHIPVASINELKEYANFTRDFVNYARASMQAGKTVEQAAKEYTVDPKYKGYVVSVNPAFGSAQANLEIAYTELKGK